MMRSKPPSSTQPQQHQRKAVSISDKVEIQRQPEEVCSTKYTDMNCVKCAMDFKVPARYAVKGLLGSGAYGTVAEAKDQEKKCSVAIKQCKHLFEDLLDTKRVLREVAILAQLNHPYIVRLHDVVVPADVRKFTELYVVLEIADSDLKKLLREPIYLTHLHLHTLWYNLLVGLAYLHDSGVMHRDLKPANCLVNEDCSVKICDFGLARAVGAPEILLDGADSPDKRLLTGHVVTRWYRAPELILLQENYTEAIDVWSVACIFAELMRMSEGQSMDDRAPLLPGKHCFPLSPSAKHGMHTPYYTSSEKEQLNMICALLGVPSKEDIALLEGLDARTYMGCFKSKGHTGVRAAFSHIDPTGVDLLEKMLVFSPSRRATAQEALKHDIFADLHNLDMENKKPAMVVLDFEKEKVLDQKSLRALFLEEVRRFHPELPQLKDIAS